MVIDVNDQLSPIPKYSMVSLRSKRHPQVRIVCWRAEQTQQLSTRRNANNVFNKPIGAGLLVQKAGIEQVDLALYSACELSSDLSAL